MPHIKRDEAADVYRAGQRMSNWLYNMAHNKELERYSESMREMVQEWDKKKKPLQPGR